MRTGFAVRSSRRRRGSDPFLFSKAWLCRLLSAFVALLMSCCLFLRDDTVAMIKVVFGTSIEKSNDTADRINERDKLICENGLRSLVEGMRRQSEERPIVVSRELCKTHAVGIGDLFAH